MQGVSLLLTPDGGRAVASSTLAWRDGCLFVGNNLSLDFVNTRPVMHGQPVELLSDWHALLRWFRAADLVSAKDVAPFVRHWENRPEARIWLDRLRTLRESLRATVLRVEAG